MATQSAVPRIGPRDRHWELDEQQDQHHAERSEDAKELDHELNQPLFPMSGTTISAASTIVIATMSRT